MAHAVLERLVESILASAMARRSTVVLAPPGGGMTTLLQRVAAAAATDRIEAQFVRFPDPRVDDLTSIAQDTLVVIDDAHRATRTQQLAVRDRALSGTVVVGARSGSAPEDLSWLWRSGLTERVDLEPLDARAVEAILEQRLGGPIHWTLVAGIMTRSGGRPGFVVDEVESMRSSGAAQESGFVRDRALDRVGVRQLERAESILDELPGPLAEATRVVAVAGALPDAAIDRYGVDAQELVRRGLAEMIGADERPTQPARLRLVPPAFAAAVRATLPPTVAVDLGRRMLESDGDTLAPVDRARLRLDLGAPLELAELAAAAWAAVTERALGAAVALARNATTYGPQGRVVAAEVFTNVGNRLEAAHCYAGLLVDDEADDLVKARAATEYASSLLWDLGRPDEAVRVAHELTASTVGGPFESLARIHEAGMLLYSGRPAAAHALLSDVDPGHLDDAWRRVFHLVRVVTMSFVAPAAPAADDVAAITLVTSIDLGGTFGPAVGVIAAELAHEFAGDWSGAAAVVAHARTDLRLDSTPQSAGWLALAEARSALGTGRLVAAGHAADESAACFADVNHPSGLRWAVGAALLASAQSGDIEACRAHAARFEGLAAGAPFLDADLLRAQAWGDWAVGDSAQAASRFAAAAGMAAAIGAPVLEATALHDSFRTTRASVSARLDELSRAHPVPSIELRARHLRLVAAEQPADLITLAGEFADHGAMLLAAEVAAGAATIATAQGRRSTARQADGLRAQWAAACGDAATPGLAGRRSAELTTRERDIATRAATGSPSKAIADDLGLSARTVENTLQRVYIKLGIHGRADLADRMASVSVVPDDVDVSRPRRRSPDRASTDRGRVRRR